MSRNGTRTKNVAVARPAAELFSAYHERGQPSDRGNKVQVVTCPALRGILVVLALNSFHFQCSSSLRFLNRCHSFSPNSFTAGPFQFRSQDNRDRQRPAHGRPPFVRAPSASPGLRHQPPRAPFRFIPFWDFGSLLTRCGRVNAPCQTVRGGIKFRRRWQARNTDQSVICFVPGPLRAGFRGRKQPRRQGTSGIRCSPVEHVVPSGWSTGCLADHAIGVDYINTLMAQVSDAGLPDCLDVTRLLW